MQTQGCGQFSKDRGILNDCEPLRSFAMLRTYSRVRIAISHSGENDEANSRWFHQSHHCVSISFVGADIVGPSAPSQW